MGKINFKKLNNSYVWCYGAILLAACLLRFWQVMDKGLFNYDDARLMHFANTLYTLIHEGVAPSRPEFFSSAKPGAIFPFLGAVFMFSPYDAIFSIYTAFWGVIVVVMTMVVTNKIFKDEATTLCAGMLSAVSPLQVHFSRSFNIAGSLSMLVVLLTLYTYMLNHEKRKIKYLALLGGMIGYAFTINYTLIPYLLLITLLVVIEEVRSSNKIVIRLIFFGLGVAAAPLACELIYKILQIKDGRLYSYFSMLSEHKTGIFNLDRQVYFDPLHYVSLFVKYDAISFLLASCGVFVACKSYKQSPNYFFLIICSLAVTLCVFLSMGTAFVVSVPRTSYSVIPLFPILGAVAIASFSRPAIYLFNHTKESGKWIMGTSLAIMIGFSLYWITLRIEEVENLRTGYKQAAMWVNNKGEKAGCYVNCIMYEAYTDNFNSLMNKAKPSVKYVIVDFADRVFLGQQDFYSFGQYDAERAFITLLDNSREPIAVFDNPVGNSELYVLESGRGRWNSQNAIKNKFNGQIRIYAIN